MEIKEIEISKLKELKEKSMMLKDERQKGKCDNLSKKQCEKCDIKYVNHF